MTSKQEQHEIDTTIQALRKRQQQIRKAIERGYFSSTPEGQQLTRDVFLGYSKAVEAHFTRLVGRSGRFASAAAHLFFQLKELEVSYDHVSFVALRKLIDCIHTKQNQRTHVCTAIGKAIQEELRNQFFTLNLDEDGRKIRDKRLKKTRSTPKYRNLGVKLSMERRMLEKGWAKDDLYQDWPSLLCTQVGSLLLDAAVKERYFEVPTKWVAKNRSEKFVIPSPALEEHLTKRTEQIDELVTTQEVLIEPPLDWQLEEGEARFNFSGGYHLPSSRKPNNPLCRGRHYETRFGSDAINLLNTLGRTAFQVDPHVFEVIDDCWEKQQSIAGFNSPFENPELKQEMPEHLKALDKKHPDRVAWRKRQAYLHDQEQEHIEKTRSAQAVLFSARKNLTRPRFWLSWSCDFRGRIYSQQSWLDPQSRDFERSVLRFADGCRLDEQGKEWAARAVGAAFGGTKQSYAARSQWTYEHAELIAAIASDPIRHSSQWENADETWQFLQLAIEWNAVVLKKTKPFWQVPISVDSTASGLQLLSAMRRDPVGMKWTNLIPSEDPDQPPRDAYLEVLRVAREIAKADPETAWLAKHLKDRSLGKPVLMIAIYGGSYRTNRGDIVDALRKLGSYPDPVSWDDTKVLTDILQKASKHVFPAAFETLEWLKKLCALAIDNGATSISWETPCGDLIHQAEYEVDSIEVDTYGHGRMRIAVGSVNKPNERRLKSGFAPNYVHSFDACLLKTAFQQWEKPVVTIHDCIGVLPNDMDDAQERIRRGMIHVCQGDLLSKLAADLRVDSNYLERLTKGSKDLKVIISADKMFN
ncbi:DNA-dependent RNA polymerase/ phage-type [Synechococcus sp. A18-46.1]|nr:DNA-dependent RNA polymerase/ phage-type [Synechococcus sp. A18-46.1]